uniref:Uncharacterized protein n=1 Tax=Mycena chlorophos TaxID=658473 RepID=A0ABQ0L516_MYCCL|nr:predicted protein [Mycena chlorophos]
MQHQPNDVGRCANCADMDMPCNYIEPGIFCDLCILSGSPRCKHTDPFAFAEQLTSWRANFLVNYVRRLHSYIEQRFMHASVFLANYEIALEWANRAVQGAIIRFESNIRATSAIATRGYGQIINATTGLADLGRFLTFAAESSFLHPSIVKAALKRGAELVDE